MLSPEAKPLLTCGLEILLGERMVYTFPLEAYGII